LIVVSAALSEVSKSRQAVAANRKIGGRRDNCHAIRASNDVDSVDSLRAVQHLESEKENWASRQAVAGPLFFRFFRMPSRYRDNCRTETTTVSI
jgi:hypothetical protein